MAVSWHIRVMADSGERFDDDIDSNVDQEVLDAAKVWGLGTRIKTRRPEPGYAVHDFEHGMVTVSRNNFQTRTKRRARYV